ncbi:MAG: DNA-3-methyladenine glycosylase [Halobacteriaceae archaeon]
MTDRDWRATLRADPRMAALLERHGPVTVDPAEHPFERLVVSVVNQSISSAAARTVRERLFDALDRPLTPGAVLSTPVETLADAGLGPQKAGYVRNAAVAYRDGDVAPESLADLDDAAVVDRVSAVRGLGPWTGRMYLIFVLGREDVFPVGDLGVRRAMASLYDLDDADRSAMREVAAAWRPYRSYATRLLWRAYERD